MRNSVSQPLGRSVRRRRGGSTIEMVLVIPAIVLFTIGIIAFGQLFVLLEQVHLACRVGVEEASQTPGLPLAGAVPSNVVDAVSHQLESSGIEFCRIRLEHNVGGGPFELITNGSLPCSSGPIPSLAMSPSPGTEYVRLSICIPLTELFPPGLTFLGYALPISGQDYECLCVMRYEDP